MVVYSRMQSMATRVDPGEPRMNLKTECEVQHMRGRGFDPPPPERFQDSTHDRGEGSHPGGPPRPQGPYLSHHGGPILHYDQHGHFHHAGPPGSAKAPGFTPRSGLRGKGPKGYKRTDERIAEDVNDVLTENDSLDATELQVTVQSGEVTLQGTVDNRFERRLAEDLADSISGVLHVQNNLRVKGASDGGSQAQ